MINQMFDSPFQKYVVAAGLRKQSDGPLALGTSAPAECKGLFYSNILKHQSEDTQRVRE